MNNPLKNKTYLQSDRNPAEYAVLGALTIGPAHGYDLYQYLLENLGSIWTLGLSQIYALLSRLDEEGLISQERQEQDKRPDRKIFTLNPHGLEIFKDWVRQPVAHVRDLRLEFLSKLHFARVRGRGAVSRLIQAQIAVLTETSRGLQAKIKSTQTFIEQQTLEFRRIQTQAAIAWLQKL